MIIPNIDFEKSLLPTNCRYVLGIDEVGRGPLAGPVTIGAFVFGINSYQNDFPFTKIRDSKLVSEKNRQLLYQYFTKNNIFKTFSSSAKEIDELGIQVCINNNIKKAVEYFSSQIDYVLVDGNMKLDLNKDYKSIISGDKKCFSIAAASICAKYERDQEMMKYHQEFPIYRFDLNKGYGTSIHLKAINDNGSCHIHRHTYKPLCYLP